MQDHSIPVIIQQLLWNMPRHVVVNFCEILVHEDQLSITPMYSRMLQTDRNKETSSPVRSFEEVWKQLQPRVVSIHDELALPGVKLLFFDLREPCILGCKGGRGIRFCKV